MGFALTPGEAPLHFSRSKNVMHVATDYRQALRIMLTTNGKAGHVHFTPYATAHNAKHLQPLTMRHANADYYQTNHCRQWKPCPNETS